MDIRVLGLGNVLMADDGLGPYVIHALDQTYDFPAGVTLVDAGTPGLDLAPFLLGANKLIVIDTVRSDAAPGTVKEYRRSEILRHAPQPRLGPHDPGLKQTLLALEFTGGGPDEVLLVGVVPERTLPVPRLAPAVRDAVPRVVAAVVAELERLNHAPRERQGATVSVPWWEIAVGA